VFQRTNEWNNIFALFLIKNHNIISTKKKKYKQTITWNERNNEMKWNKWNNEIKWNKWNHAK
jgi:hypothetical protein